MASMTGTEERNKKGEWRPPYPCAHAPLFTWPLRPVAILKWVVSYPGFMWPRNLGLLLVSAAAWYWTQPDLARCTRFSADSIGQIWLRNLVLMWLWYGSYHLLLYKLKTEGVKGKYDARWPAQNSPVFLFRDQIYDNV